MLTNVNRLGRKEVFLWPWYDRKLTRLYLHENNSVSGREMRLNQANCKSLEAKFLGILQTFNTGPFLKISKIFSNKLTSPCIIFYTSVGKLVWIYKKHFERQHGKTSCAPVIFHVSSRTYLEELTIKKSIVRQLWCLLEDRYFCRCLLLALVCRIRLSRHIASTYRIAQIRFCDSCCWAAQSSFRYLSRGQHSQNVNQFPYEVKT